MLRHLTAFALVTSFIGCAADGNAFLADDARLDSKYGLAAPGRWQSPANILAAGDRHQVTYTGAGPWIGPSGCQGTFTKGAQALKSYIEANFRQVSSIIGYSCRAIGGSSNMSVHATGRALDIMLPTAGGSADNTAGDAIANWLILNAEDLGVQFIIWDRSTWSPTRAAGTRQRYYTGEDDHVDHIHVEISVASGQRNVRWLQDPNWQPQGQGAQPPGQETDEREPVPTPEEDAEAGEGRRPFPSACRPLDAAGGVIDNDNPCLELLGPMEYWRDELSAGHEDGLVWTNAFESGNHTNFATWHVGVVEPKPYEVQVYVDAVHGQFSDTRYTIERGDDSLVLSVDQGRDKGWVSLGVYELSPDVHNRISIFDNTDHPVAENRRIVVDALRIFPEGEEPATDEGDAHDDGAEPPENDDSDSEIPAEESPLGEVISGCQTSGSETGGLPVLLLLAGLFLRRRGGP